METDYKYRYDFDQKTGILYKYYYGEISINDITESWEYAKHNGLIPKTTKGFILDYRNARFIINILENSEQDEISNYYRKNLDIFGGHKIAVVTDNSDDVVVPILVMEKDFGYLSKPFATIEAALKWVLY